MNSKTILSPVELRSRKGIRFSRQHLHRLVKVGKFPAPLKLGLATNGWLESEIDAWIEARAQEREDVISAARDRNEKTMTERLTHNSEDSDPSQINQKSKSGEP